MSLHVSIDFGTSSTCTVASVGGGEPHVVVIDGQPLVPSAVFAAPDGTLFVGHEAERQAAIDPARFEPHPKRRVDEGELLLGPGVYPVSNVLRAVLGRAVTEARRYAGGTGVDLLVLTHPADWGTVRTGVLRQAAAGLAREIALVPEPVAAAVFHSAGHGMPNDGALAVLDLGGGTIDASVVRKRGGTFQVLATRGDPHFGGADIDQFLLEHIGGLLGGTDTAGWRKLVSGRDMADRRRRRVLRQDVRGAKETLSRHTYTDVPLPPPFPDAHVTRGDLEGLIMEPLSRSVRLVATTLRAGDVRHAQLAGVFLVGGSSRIPLVARLMHERTGIVPTTLDQPETVVARGALRAVRLDPERSGGLAPAGDWSRGRTVRHSGPGAPTAVCTAVAEAPAANPPDSLSDARTIVIGGSDQTRPVSPAAFRHRGTRRKARRTRWFVTTGVLVIVAVVALVGALTAQGNTGEEAGTRELAQFGYSFRHPADWGKIGNDPELWRTTLAPEDGSGAGDRIAVQQGELDYDVAAAPERAVRELRSDYERRVEAGESFSGFAPTASFGGSDVVYYREQRPAATVEWYVLHEGNARLSVGCQHTPSGHAKVQRACEQVVGSLRTR